MMIYCHNFGFTLNFGHQNLSQLAMEGKADNGECVRASRWV